MGSSRVTWSDIGLTALLLLFGLYGSGPAAANQGQTLPPAAYLLVIAACLPVAVRRQWPTWAFGLTGAVTLTYLGLGYAHGPILFALVAACYGLAVRSPFRHAVTGTAALLAASVAAVGAGVAGGGRQWSELISVAAWLVIPAAVGVAVKVRRDAASDVRAEQARRAVSEERLQLVQEVHDVVGHGLAVVAMQAGVALRLVDRDPVRTRAALEAIRATSTEALDGLRAELDALRTPDRHPPLRPNAGLADLPALAGRISSGGLPVSVDLADSARYLSADVDLAVYRIVQESLTNVLRHAGPNATARVRVRQRAGTLHVEVLDTGRGAAGPPAARSGHGIDGMRARAEALGGTLDAGPRPGGGFAVQARLPAGQPAYRPPAGQPAYRPPVGQPALPVGQPAHRTGSGA